MQQDPEPHDRASTGLPGASGFWWIILVTLVAMAPLLRAAAIYGGTSDTDVRSDPVVLSSSVSSLLAGASGSPALDRSSIFVFRLPDLGAVANPFTSAVLRFNLSGITGTPPNVDLYGLGRRSSPTVLAGDYYGGTTTADPSDATFLQDNILVPATPTGTVSTSSGGGTALNQYLNTQYAGGAGAGGYVFLRLSGDSVSTSVRRYSLTSADGGSAGPPDTRPQIIYNLPSGYTRPFIWVRDVEKAGILGKIADQAWAAGVYNGMISRVAADLASHQSDRDGFLRQLPVDWTLAPAKFKTIPAYPESAVRYPAEAKFNDALDCAVLHYLTGDVKYARCAADILHNAVKTLLPVAASAGTGNGGWIFQDDFLKEARVTGTQLAIVYDFLHPYLQGNQVYDVQTGGMVNFSFTTAQSVFRKLYQLARDHGQKDSNWSALMATTMLNNLLALDSATERDAALQVYLVTGSARQASLDYDYRDYAAPGNIWHESLQYAGAVGSIRTSHMVLLERVDPNLNLFDAYPNLPLSLPRISQLRYPNGQQVSFGDGYRDAGGQPFFEYELVYQHALGRGRTGLASTFGSLINGGVAAGTYNRSTLNGYSTLGQQNEPLQLLWQAPAVTGPAVEPELPRTDTLPFAGIALQRNPAPANNPTYGLMGFVGGGAHVHSHASGMSMELYGMGQVMGAKSGRDDYGATLHENHYRLFAANNTVIVNGASRGEGGWQDIGINTVQTVAMEPQPFDNAVSPDFSFTCSSFADNKGIQAEGTQQRTLAIVRTSPTTGFYVDLFRSKSTVTNRTATTLNGTVTNQYHDYIYRNIGETTVDLRADGVTLPLVSQPNRFQNDIGDAYQQPGWRYFTNTVVSYPTSQAVRAQFVATVAGTPRYMDLHMPAVASREYARVTSPPIVDAPSPYNTRNAPTLVIRQIGEAWNKAFAAVYEPHFGATGGSVRNVTQLLRAGIVVGVKVESTIGAANVVHYILANPAAGETYTDASVGLSFTGRFGVAADHGDGTATLYLGEGSSLSYLGNSLATVSGAASQAEARFVPGQSPVVTANSAVNVVAAPPPPFATWVPSAASPGLDWTTATHWNPQGIPDGVGSVASKSINLAGNQTVNVNNPVTLGELIVGDSNGSQTTLLRKNTNGSLVFDQTGSGIAYLTRTAGGTGDVTFKDDLNITLNDNLTVRAADGAASSTMTIAGTLSGLGKVLIKEGGNLTLNLSGNNTYTGTTLVNGGTLALSGSGTLGDGAALTLNGGRLDLGGLSAAVGAVSVTAAAASGDAIRNGSLAGTSYAASNTTGNAVVSANLLANGAAGFAKSGAGTTTLSGTNTYTGTTAVTGGVLRLNHSAALGSGNLNLSGGGIVGLGAGNFTRPAGAGAGAFQWVGNGGFAAYGADRTVSPGTLSWASSSLEGNTLILGAADADATVVWASNISLAGGSRTIQVNNGPAAVDARISGVISAGGTLNKTGTGTLAVSNTNTFTGAVVVNGGTLQLGNGGTTGNFNAISSIAITSGTLTMNRSNAFNQTTDLAGRIISGAGSFVQAGSGTTTLALPNTWSGTTTIAAGKLAFGAGNVLADTTAVSIGSATLDVATFTDTVGTLDVTGAATIQLGAGGKLAFADSRAIDWTGGMLNLTGTFVSGSSLRFGTTRDGLTLAQVALITATGFGPFALDDAGYLTAGPATGYGTWAAINAPTTGADPGADEDGDGVPNGIEYVLGGTSQTNDLAKLPVATITGGNFVFSFIRDQSSIDGATAVTIELGETLADWSQNFPVPAAAVANNPGISVQKNVPVPGEDTISLSLPSGSAGKAFARLKVIVQP